MSHQESGWCCPMVPLPGGPKAHYRFPKVAIPLVPRVIRSQRVIIPSSKSIILVVPPPLRLGPSRCILHDPGPFLFPVVSSSALCWPSAAAAQTARGRFGPGSSAAPAAGVGWSPGCRCAQHHPLSHAPGNEDGESGMDLLWEESSFFLRKQRGWRDGRRVDAIQVVSSLP